MHSNRGKVLVTGAAGFLGQSLALRLAADGYQVRGTVRPAGNRCAALAEAGIEVVEADVGSRDDLDRAIEGCFRVFHVAAVFRRAGLPDDEYRRVNRDGTQAVIAAAVDAQVDKIIHCSTVGVCGHVTDPPADETTPYRPGDIYQVSKMEGEQFALAAFREGLIRGTVVRPGSIYGPGDYRLLKLFRLIARRRFVVVGDGRANFHTVYIDDIVDGLIRAMDAAAADGEAFIVAGPEYLPLNRLFAIIARTLGVPEPRFRVPAAPVQMLGSAVEAVCIPLGIEPPIYRRRVDFFTKNRAFDISKARKILGYAPQVSVEEGIERTATWYQREGLL